MPEDTLCPRQSWCCWLSRADPVPPTQAEGTRVILHLPPAPALALPLHLWKTRCFVSPWTVLLRDTVGWLSPSFPCLSPLQTPAPPLQDERGESGPLRDIPHSQGGQESPRSSPGRIQTSFAGAQAVKAAVSPSPAVFWVNFCPRQQKSIPPAAPVLLGDVPRAALPHLPQIIPLAANNFSTKTPLQGPHVSGDWDGQTHLSSAPTLPSPAAFVSSSCSV